MLRHDVDSPVGRLVLLADDAGLRALLYPGPRAEAAAHTAVRDAGPFAEVVGQLEEYFAGERTDFTLRLAPQGTAFQLAVWEELRRIPFGRTCSYGQVAAALGAPGAARAVGMANNRNPISIVVPCHRVVGSTGALTGYGGGLTAKTWLLDLESRDRVLF